ncbi:MAG: penicillin-binding protein 2 [candidate division WS1 bacterium]|nr:penicillin-binding protein 2 [candidate division WS1 bacterium]
MTGFDLRIKTFGLFVGVLLVMLTGRLWLLQLTHWVDYRGQALQNRTSIVSTPAPRGLIYDREGRVLAENRPNWSIVITPAELPTEPEKREDVIKRLASILRERGVSTADVRDAIAEACKAASVTPTPLGKFAEDLSLSAVAQIEERRFELPGVGVAEQFKRHYPYDDLASHVLGYARAITGEQYEQWRHLQYPGSDEQRPDELGIEPWQNDPVYGNSSIFGQSGIEAAYELDEAGATPVPVLQGRRGMRIWEVDVHNRPLRLIREERVPQQGAGVYLTLDLDLQRVAEEALAEAVGNTRTGAAVLMDVRTGGVLVMASKPSIDPNRWVAGFSSGEYQKLAEDPRHPFYNKAISGTYPPGSIFKMVSVLAALETTDVRPESRFVCSGQIRLGSPTRPYYHKCWKNHGGALNMWEGIAQSCDVYFYELVRKAGTSSDAIAKYARLFGMGTSTNCGLPGEADGIVPDRDWKAENRPNDPDWYTGDTLQYVIGQSFLKVTPLQMAVVTAAVANGGTVISPRLVRKIDWPEYLGRGPTLYRAQVVREVEVDPDNLRIAQEGMRRAVTDPQGTARTMADLDFTSAAKTGSAQFELGRKTHAWFACYAPYENPRYACVVLVTEAGHGSEVAGPVAKKIMAAAMHRGTEAQAGVQELLPEPPSEEEPQEAEDEPPVNIIIEG